MIVVRILLFVFCLWNISKVFSSFSQKAHVQQFIATEDELNKAAEARSTCQKLLKRLYGSGDFDPSHPQSMSSLRQLEVIQYWWLNLLTLFYLFLPSFAYK